jgi:hypothetical protein
MKSRVLAARFRPAGLTCEASRSWTPSQAAGKGVSEGFGGAGRDSEGARVFFEVCWCVGGAAVALGAEVGCGGRIGGGAHHIRGEVYRVQWSTVRRSGREGQHVGCWHDQEVWCVGMVWIWCRCDLGRW